MNCYFICLFPPTIYTSLYSYVLSTVLRTSKFYTLYIDIFLLKRKHFIVAIFQRFFKGKDNATQRLVRILLNFYSSTHLLQPGAQTGTRTFFLVLTIILAINSQV